MDYSLDDLSPEVPIGEWKPERFKLVLMFTDWIVTVPRKMIAWPARIHRAYARNSKHSCPIKNRLITLHRAAKFLAGIALLTVCGSGLVGLMEAVFKDARYAPWALIATGLSWFIFMWSRRLKDRSAGVGDNEPRGRHGVGSPILQTMEA